MNITDLVNALNKEKLVEAHVGTSIKTYVSEDAVIKNGSWKNLTDVYGIYKVNENKYCFFITDSERGIPEYSAVFDSEASACDALIEKISRCERIYKSKHLQ